MCASVFSMTPRVIVGISDLAVTNSPSVVLSTYALGSCVGVVALAPKVRAAGLLHAMLPKMGTKANRQNTPLMFVDTGMQQMLKELSSFGISKSMLKIALIGGASVNSGGDFFEIGSNNVKATKEFCRANGLRIAYEDTGGKVNRTVHLQLSDLNLQIKKPQKEESISLQ